MPPVRLGGRARLGRRRLRARHQEDRRPAAVRPQVGGQEGQQLPALPSGQVQVLDQQHQRPVGSIRTFSTGRARPGDLLQLAGDLPEDPEAGPGVGLAVGPIAPIGSIASGPVHAVEGVEAHAEAFEDLEEGLERPAAVGARPAQQHPGAVDRRQQPELPQQARLAALLRPFDHQRPGAVPLRRFQLRRQPVDRRLPPHQTARQHAAGAEGQLARVDLPAGGFAQGLQQPAGAGEALAPGRAGGADRRSPSSSSGRSGRWAAQVRALAPEVVEDRLPVAARRRQASRWRSRAGSGRGCRGRRGGRSGPGAAPPGRCRRGCPGCSGRGGPGGSGRGRSRGCGGVSPATPKFPGFTSRCTTRW